MTGIVLAKTKGTKYKQRVLLSGICINLSLLFGFKHFTYLKDILVFLLPEHEANYIANLHLLTPLGLSFFTFQAISYLIDVFNSTSKECRRFTDFALYISFFPQLITGPIVRSRDFFYQLNEKKQFSNIRLKFYLSLIMFGFLKKIAIADQLGSYLDTVFTNIDLYSSSGIFLSIVCRYLQVFCDFSAYSDISVGMAGLLGYSIPKNFHFTLLAENIIERWVRWHSTFYAFLKEYVFFEFARIFHNRLKSNKLSLLCALVVTFMFSGLWHGIGFNYFLWSLIHVLVYLLCFKYLKNTQRIKFPKTVNHILVISYFALINVFFMPYEFTEMKAIFVKVFEFKIDGFEINWEMFCLSLTPYFIQRFCNEKSLESRFEKLPDHVYIFISAFIVSIIIGMASFEIAPFIYFKY
jgi:D-alanyl-lipoteichoic acid acyltransferase DltB (MBOAT superfamily)